MPLFNRTMDRHIAESNTHCTESATAKPATAKPALAAPALVMGAVLALSSIAQITEAQAESDVDISMTELTTPAGHTFWYFPMPDAKRTAMAFDWAQEVPLGEGSHPAIAEVGVEIMLKGGAGGRDAAQIVADFEDLDAGSDLWVRPRGVTGYFVAPDKHLSKAREIAQQVLTKPAFEQRWFDREHQIMIESAVDERSDSWGMAWILIRDVLLDDHPYNKFWSFNSLDEFEAVSLDDVKKWYESSFSTKTATIAVAGSADAETVAKEIDLLFADMPANAPIKPMAMKKPNTTGKTILLHNPDAPKSVVVIVGNYPPNSEASNTELDLAVGVFGKGQQSRLFKTVRAGLGATYGFGAGVSDVTLDHRIIEMSGEIETKKLQEALKEIEQAYTEFRGSGVSPEEFKVAKTVYKRNLKEMLQRPANVAFELNQAVREGYSAEYMKSTFSRIDSMDINHVNSVVSDSFPAYEGMLKLIVTPDDKAVDGACVISKIEDAKDCL